MEGVVEAVCDVVVELVIVGEGVPVRVFVIVIVLEGVVEGVLGREAVLELVTVWLLVPERLAVCVREGVLELEGV